MFEKNISKYLQQYGFEHIWLKAVLFDMDGVLFDSMPMHAKAWAEAAQRFNFDLTEEEAYEHEGRTGKSTIDILAQRCWGRQATEAEEKQIYEVKSNIQHPAQGKAHAGSHRPITTNQGRRISNSARNRKRTKKLVAKAQQELLRNIQKRLDGNKLRRKTGEAIGRALPNGSQKGRHQTK